MSVDYLRNIHWALQELIRSWGEQESLLRLSLIDDARVPILQVWCPGADLAMDISVDQSLPVDHVRGFGTMELLHGLIHLHLWLRPSLWYFVALSGGCGIAGYQG
jgi:hypothetical protein